MIRAGYTYYHFAGCSCQLSFDKALCRSGDGCWVLPHFWPRSMCQRTEQQGSEQWVPTFEMLHDFAPYLFSERTIAQTMP